MSTDYRPLRIAVVSDGRDSWQAFRLGQGWESFDPGIGFVADENVTDVRPLIVLDPREHGFDPALLVRHLRRNTGYLTLPAAIEEQSRPPKPPRIPEPGWGEKVTARAGDDPNRYEWLRYTTNPNVKYQWVSEFCSPRPWDDLIDPTLIREGVES